MVNYNSNGGSIINGSYGAYVENHGGPATGIYNNYIEDNNFFDAFSGLTSTQSTWWHGTILPGVSVGSGGNAYVQYDDLAYVQLSGVAGGQTLSITAVNTADGTYAAVYSNDGSGEIEVGRVVFSGSTNVSITRTVLLPAGNNLIIRIEAVYMGIQAVNLSSFSVLLNTSSINNRCVFYGDSVTFGQAALGVENGYANLIRKANIFSETTIFGVSGKTIANDSGTALLVAATTSSLSSRLNGVSSNTLIYGLGVNDWIGNVNTPTQASGFLANQLDSINAARSDLIIYYTQPFLETSEGANGLGFTLNQYRTAYANVVNARSSFVTLVDSPNDLYTTAVGGGGGGPHPVTSEHLSISIALIGFITSSTNLDSIPGVVAFLVPESSGSSDGTAISTLASGKTYTGHANWDFTQATTAFQPVIKTGLSPNGKRILRFNGINNFGVAASAQALPAARQTYICAKMQGSTTPAFLCDAQAASGSGLVYINSLSPAVWVLANGAFLVSSGTQPDPTTGFRKISATINGTTSSIRVDGNTIVTGNAGTNTANGYTLGANGATTAGAWDIAGFAVADRILSSRNISRLEAWMAIL